MNKCGKCCYASNLYYLINFNMVRKDKEIPRCQNKESEKYGKYIYARDTCRHFKEIE